MLTVCPTFIAYAQYAASRGAVPVRAESLSTPILLEPFRYTVYGRMSSIRSALESTKGARLIQTIPSKLKAAGGEVDMDVDEWLNALNTASQHQSKYQYLNLDGRPHSPHARAVSRFHAIIKREEIDPAADRAAAAAAAKFEADLPASPSSMIVAPPIRCQSIRNVVNGDSAGSSTSASAVQSSKFRYSIFDLESLNGLCINDVHIFSMRWTVLEEGARISFGPSGRTARRTFKSRGGPAAELKCRSSEEIQQLDRAINIELIFNNV